MNPFLQKEKNNEFNADLMLRAHIAGELEGTVDRPCPEESAAAQRPERKSYPRFAQVSLPKVSIPRPRHSVQAFSGKAVGLEAFTKTISPLFTDAGSTNVRPAAPSAGALLPVEAYVLPQRVEGLAQKVHYVDTDDQRLTELFPLPEEPLDDGLVLECTPAPGAAFMVCLSGVLYRSFRKYGVRSYRYVNHEVGALALALNLAALDAGLEACWLGSFNDEKVCEILGLQPALELEVPLLLVAFGSAPVCEREVHRSGH